MATVAGLRVANVFHAGDKLHPLVLYDRAISGEEERPWICLIAFCICA